MRFVTVVAFAALAGLVGWILGGAVDFPAAGLLVGLVAGIVYGNERAWRAYPDTSQERMERYERP